MLFGLGRIHSSQHSMQELTAAAGTQWQLRTHYQPVTKQRIGHITL